MKARKSPLMPLIRRKLLPLLGISFSIVILAIVASLFNFNLNMILSIDPYYLALSTLCSLAVLLLQGMRFKYIIESFTDKGPFSIRESFAVRIGSQFVAMTTPAYVGGEVARAAWLTTKGISPGTALWLPYIEIIFDVYSTGVIALLAGIIAMYHGAPFLGTLLVAMALLMLALMTVVIFVSRRHAARIPSFVSKFTVRILGEKRGEELVFKAEKAMNELKIASQNTINRSGIRKLLVLAIYTILLAMFTALTLYFIAAGLSIHLSIEESLLVVFASVLLGNLPVTFGGAGLAEAGVYYYSSLVFNVYSWPMVFAWRLTSYIVPLIITGLSGTLVLHNYTKMHKDK